MRILGRRSRTAGSAYPHRDYRPSLELGWCESFAFQLAHYRGSSRLEPRDILGGIFIAALEFPRIARYWREWGEFEHLVVAECGNIGARIIYWLALWDGVRRPKAGLYAPFGSKRRSPDLDKIYAAAKDLASAREGELRGAPVVAPEDLLLAMVRRAELPISGRLLSSGLVMARLEEAVRTIAPQSPA
jgi:hypothetical protein